MLMRMMRGVNRTLPAPGHPVDATAAPTDAVQKRPGMGH